MAPRPDIVIVMTDQERAAPPYESSALTDWRRTAMPGRRWFDDHGVSFGRHYTGSLACVPSRPTLFTGQYPDVHGVTQTDGVGKDVDDSRMRWLPPGQVPTLGHWFRCAGYDTHYDGKWHISHADLHDADGLRIATNTANGTVLPDGVAAYVEADPLDEYGFSGWVGPEPHGALAADNGLNRDPLLADRVVAWLEDRYARRRAGDADAQRPFLLVASFLNPHDIVFHAVWAVRSPLAPRPDDPPPEPPPSTAREDLSTKPRAQSEYRAAFFSGFGAAPVVGAVYDNFGQRERDLYHRLHLENDDPIDRVRRAVTDGGSEHAVLVRTSDHGELLGSHGGLHQKWFQMYDESTRVPFVVVRTGEQVTTPRIVDDAPTSHVDLVPTLLSAAGVDVDAVSTELAERFTEVHPLPGRDLMPVVDGDSSDPRRVVYLQTRDNIFEGDTGVSVIARQLGFKWAPGPLRIRVPADVGSSFEAVVARVSDDEARGGAGHLWKLVRTFDDADTWTEPGRRTVSAVDLAGERTRSVRVADEWELYDLDDDAVEERNRWNDPDAGAVFDHLVGVLWAERARSVPARHDPWPYAPRRTPGPSPATVPGPRAILDRVLAVGDDLTAR